MKRIYSMVRRGETKAASRDLILDAAEHFFSQELYENVSLNRIAGEAGLGIQTVLRHFPTKETLFLASMTRSLEKADKSRNYLPGQSLEESVLQLLSYYESHGATIINYLNQVATNPAFAPITQAGGEAHARWIKVLFSSYFKFGNDNNPILQKQIEVILDIRVWELLRYRKGLSVEEVSRVITGLLKPFCDFPKATGDGSSFPA